MYKNLIMQSLMNGPKINLKMRMIPKIKQKRPQVQIFWQAYLEILQIHSKTSHNNIKDYRYKINNFKCFKISFN
jgi:hypothetical protein